MNISSSNIFLRVRFSARFHHNRQASFGRSECKWVNHLNPTIFADPGQLSASHNLKPYLFKNDHLVGVEIFRDGTSFIMFFLGSLLMNCTVMLSEIKKRILLSFQGF